MKLYSNLENGPELEKLGLKTSSHSFNPLNQQGKIGCGTIIGILLLLSFLFSVVVVGGVGYISYELAKNPRQFMKENPQAIKSLGQTLIKAFNSSDPLVGEVLFDPDAYNSFLQKQGELAKSWQSVQDQYPFELSATREEILSFLKQDLAAWGIYHFDMEFFKDRLKFNASVPGPLILQRLPANFPEPLKESFKSLDYLNLQGDMNFLFDNGIQKFEIHDFKIGSLKISEVFMDLFNEQIKGEIRSLETSLFRLMQGINVKPRKVQLKDGEILISGSTDRRPQ